MSLNYASLQNLLIERSERTLHWQNELFEQAVAFSVALKDKLSPPEKPIELPSTSETWLPFLLAEPLEADRQTTISNPLCNPGFEKFIAKGALSFSIILGFEETNPTCSIICSCMVRIQDGIANFGFGEGLEVVSNWYTLENAVIAFLERIEAAYHSDSFARTDKPPVGFVHLQADG